MLTRRNMLGALAGLFGVASAPITKGVGSESMPTGPQLTCRDFAVPPPGYVIKEITISGDLARSEQTMQFVFRKIKDMQQNGFADLPFPVNPAAQQRHYTRG
jgi:hypothetical protein